MLYSGRNILILGEDGSFFTSASKCYEFCEIIHPNDQETTNTYIRKNYLCDHVSFIIKEVLKFQNSNIPIIIQNINDSNSSQLISNLIRSKSKNSINITLYNN